MESFVWETKAGAATVREAVPSDIPALIALNKKCFPKKAEKNVVWGASQLANHMRLFPEGQLVVVVDGEVAGAVSSLIVDLGRDPLRPHTYAGITDGGYFHNHDPHGDTLYGADVYVDPARHGLRLGAALYEGRRRVCQKLNLRRILAGGRLWSYREHAAECSPEEYVKRVETGEVYDKVLSFQLREGFQVRGILRNYILDEHSCNLATFIEWLNPDYQPPAAENTKVRLACVQYQMRRVRDFDEFAAQVEYFVDTAADYRADFVLFPEFLSVQLLSQTETLSSIEGIRHLATLADDFRELMAGQARKYGVYIIAGSHPVAEDQHLFNECFIFRPDGTYVSQRKLHITPAERKYWGITGGSELILLQTPKVKIGVQICYDIEFPEPSRYLADQGAELIFVPYCTDNREGYLRVRHCAQARAIENQVYVATAGVVGNLPSVPAMDIHYGQAAVYTPSDFSFARDGVQAQADTNVETLLVTDLDVSDLYRSRTDGSVTPRLDRRRDLFDIRFKLKSVAGQEDTDVAVPIHPIDLESR